MARLRGWAPKGQRCRAAVPHGHWKTIDLRRRTHPDGIIAPMLLDGRWTVSSSSLGASRCWRRPCGLATSSSWTICQPTRSPASGAPSKLRGATLLYLPPYSPDFNPIENAFAKLKAHVRKHAARTIDALEAAAADALRQFKPAECANFFAHAGYGFD